ncbi:MAG TPA: group III truncated hemoglobin [Cyclobacteriaceae bacterium]|nr:group III truncated hemoglobin [Cyclobacteriaceae bacterium]
MSKPDINTREDIILLINTFYGKVRENNILGYIFNDVARVDWESHLPKMYSFWASMLLGERSFEGSPMSKHIALSRMTRMSSIEFSEWLYLFKQTVDELFEGEKAAEAKMRAENIAGLMLHRIESV